MNTTSKMFEQLARDYEVKIYNDGANFVLTLYKARDRGVVEAFEYRSLSFAAAVLKAYCGA